MLDSFTDSASDRDECDEDGEKDDEKRREHAGIGHHPARPFSIITEKTLSSVAEKTLHVPKRSLWSLRKKLALSHDTRCILLTPDAVFESMFDVRWWVDVLLFVEQLVALVRRVVDDLGLRLWFLCWRLISCTHSSWRCCWWVLSFHMPWHATLSSNISNKNRRLCAFKNSILTVPYSRRYVCFIFYKTWLKNKKLAIIRS